MVLLGEKPRLGDRVEISRGIYCHWTIYVGDGDVVHVTSTDEFRRNSSFCSSSATSNKAVVKREPLRDVMGEDIAQVNNKCDMKYQPRPVEEIINKANKAVGKEVNYDMVCCNCEHFANFLRYGFPRSEQAAKGLSWAGLVGLLIILKGNFKAWLHFHNLCQSTG
ncbi:phospholipase A and acyltransferase 3-like [Hemicordylus capensis]|uniref:phospholipase A and acyltransferase 3-like n=1 Tax=Hemicordylus capensis TaxID=884348 RepID=UPI002304AE2B|nr:phospholipase A and acyltransferase 3-like [Hemicordylus capensis]XP_053156848.1 phospholipase A and acyltransferase 3-like [Hemicordylus capensis]